MTPSSRESDHGPCARLFLARHGEVAAPWRERIYGCLDVPLSERGEEQSRLVAALYSGVALDRVVSSGLARADFCASRIVEAAASAGDAPTPWVRDPRLREIDRGDWAGWDRPTLEQASPGAWEAFWEADGVFVPPGGETLEAVQARVAEALDEHARQLVEEGGDGARAAIVAHKWVVRAACCTALDVAMESSHIFAVPTSAVVVLDWPMERERQAPRLVGFGVDQLAD